MTMITPASVSDWTMMGGLVASLGLFSALGHKWMLRDSTEGILLTEVLDRGEEDVAA